MKSKIILVALALMGAGAWAATPVAIWDGDFTATQTGFTLNRSGNAISQDNSTITIDQDVGVQVDSATGFSAAMTVMFKYSDLAFDAQKTLATSFCSGYDANRTGVYVASDGKINGIWNTADWAHPAQTLSASSGVLAFCYSKAGGTSLYSVGASSRSELFNESGLKASNDTAINGCTIGGERAKSGATLLGAATGMKITGIAIFDGILTEAEMTGYIWPSEIQTIDVNANMSVSVINAQYDSTTYKVAKVTVASGVTITVDAAFNEKIQSVSSTGTVTLSAETQPDLSGITFDVKGALLRSWLTPGVVGFNFRSANGTDVSGALATADNWIHDNNSASGTSTAMFADGLSTLKWSSANTWACSGSTIISGYLDDGANGGNGATVTLSNVPYETYDVIVYCSSDTANGDFLAKTVNGTTYTWDSTAGAVVVGNSTWGKAALSTPVYGVNALRIKNLSGPLTIYGLAKNGNSRGGIAAIEIMPPNTPDNIRTYTLTLSGTATTWSAGTWTLNGQTVDAPASGYVEIVASASTALTVDQAVNLADLKVRGDTNIVINVATNDTGSLYAIKATVESGVFQQGSPAVLGATPSIVVASGATFDENGMAVNAANAVTIAGAGAGNWPWALTSSSGAGGAILGGLYLSANATIGGANELKVGQTQAGYQCYLQGFTLTKTGAGAFTGTNMNTPGTGTIDVQGGAMSVNQWNNLNSASGDTTVILNSGTSLANGTDRIVPMSALGLYGGTLSTASKAFKVNSAFRGAGETANLAFGAGASASLTGDLTVTATMTLDGSMTFLKDAEAASDVVVAPATLAASTGTITVGAGVTFNVGTSRPTATITVQNGGTLAAQLQSVSDIIELTASAQPANITLYDENGTVVTEPRVTYSDGTLTIMPPVPTLPVSGTVAFDTAANWAKSTKPTAGGNAIIELEGDAVVTVASNYTLGSLTIIGAGVLSFSGDGTIAAANISVKNGATFTRNANISATTGIDIASGTVLRINGVAESAVISGDGAVETYGDVTMGANNTFTGGITAKTGTLATSTYGGFGGAKDDGNYAVTVEDGACLDIANTADTTHNLTIAGKGVQLLDGSYSGAVKNSGGTAYGIGSRQTKSITLTADALVDASTGWGIVRSAHNEATLALNGHTLTIQGAGTFPMANVNASSSAGTIVLEGATLEIDKGTVNNYTDVEIVAKGGSTVKFGKAPTAVGAVTIAPTATASVAVEGYANLSGVVVPAVKTAYIDTAALTNGDTLTLMMADTALTEGENVTVTAGSRYTTTVSGQNVTATVENVLAAQPFLHYDFDAENSLATDSKYNIGNLNPTLVAAIKGKAGTFDSTYRPYYGSNSSNKAPFYAGELSAISLMKIREANNTIIWNFGSGWNDGIALIAKDSTTVALVSWTGGAAGSDVVAVSGVANLMNMWHLIAFVADANGTTLYVDGQSATTSTVLPASIGGQGQFGSIHGTAKNYAPVTGDGYLLDDWRVYDAALTATEVATIRAGFFNTVTITVPSVANTEVAVNASIDYVVDNGDGTYTVFNGATVTVNYTSDDYEVTGGEFEFTATEGYTVNTDGVTLTPYVASITVGTTTTKYTSIQAAITAAGGSEATITVLADSSENLTIPADTRVAIDDASGLFTGNITVGQGGILDLSNRTAADCVACTDLTLEKGAGILLPAGVVGSARVASGSLTADATVTVKMGTVYDQTFIVASSTTGMLALRALRAAAKPAAVWNADFEDGVKHGKVALNLNGNAVQNGIITITDSDVLGTAAGGGVRFEIETSTITNRHLTAIVGIKTNEVDLANEPYLVTVAHYNGTAETDVLYDKVGLLLKAASDTYQAGTILGIWNATEWANVTGKQWPAGEDKHYFTYRYNATSSTSYDAEGRGTSGRFGTDGTTAYFDGDTNAFYSASGLRNSGNSAKEFIRAMTLGGYYCADTTERHQRSLTGATIDYVAIFTQDDYATEDAIKAWTLSGIASAETVPATGTAIAGGSSVGVNLNGGTITISEPVSAAAVFVQEDTTLEFTDEGKLSIADNGMFRGPVYVAEGKTLTIAAGSVAGELIHGAVYGDVVMDATTAALYITDGGIYSGGVPEGGGPLTIVLNGDAVIAGTGSETFAFTKLEIYGSGELTVQACTIAADSLTVADGAALKVAADATLTADTATVNGTLKVLGNFGTTGGLTMAATGTLDIAQATLPLTGGLTLQPNTTLVLASAASTQIVTGTVTADCKINVKIGETTRTYVAISDTDGLINLQDSVFSATIAADTNFTDIVWDGGKLLPESAYDTAEVTLTIANGVAITWDISTVLSSLEVTADGYYTLKLPSGSALPYRLAQEFAGEAPRSVWIDGTGTEISGTANGYLATAGRTAFKPLAVWNRDFADEDVRGAVQVSLNGNSVQEGAVHIKQNTGGLLLANTANRSYMNTHYSAVIGMSGVILPSEDDDYAVLATTYKDSGSAAGMDYKGLCIEPGTAAVVGWWNGAVWANETVRGQYPDDQALHYFGYYSMDIRDGTVGGTREYLDGSTIPLYNNPDLRASNAGMCGLNIGGLRGDGKHQLIGAQVGYVAIIANVAATAEDFAAWSLVNMTGAETVAPNGTITGGANVGINLNGGTITIDSPITAAAVFVQEDTTLKFTGSGRLDLLNNGSYLGPVYVAEGKTLTIDASGVEPDSGKAARLIRGAIYGNWTMANTPVLYVSDCGIYKAPAGELPGGLSGVTATMAGDTTVTGTATLPLNYLKTAGGGTLAVNGYNLEATTLTVAADTGLTLADDATLTGTSLTVAAEGALALTGQTTLATLTVAGQLTVNANSATEATTLTATTLTAEVGSEVTIAGRATIGTVTANGSATVTAGGILTANTLAANGDLTVAAGGEFKANGGTGLTGFVTVADGGTLTSLANDAMNYNQTCHIHLYGTLDMGTTRWTLGSNNQLYFYEGCTIAGTGQAVNGAFDLFGAGTLINVMSGAVTISPTIRVRNLNAKVYTAPGTTLTLNNMHQGGASEHGMLYKTGNDGKVVILGEVTAPEGIMISEGTVALGAEATVAVATVVTENGILDVSSGAQCAGAVTLDNFATVVVPATADLDAGVQLTTSTLTAGNYATIVKGEETREDVRVEVKDDTKLALAAQPDAYTATVSGTIADAGAIEWTEGTPGTTDKLKITLSGDTVVNGGALEAALVEFTVPANTTLTIANCTVTAAIVKFDCGEGATVQLDAAALNGTIKGNGTLVYDATLPTGALFGNGGWQGTVHIKNIGHDGTESGLGRDFAPGAYGNAKSTVRLENVVCYLPAEASVCDATIELQDKYEGEDFFPALTLDYAVDNSKVHTFKALSGSGMLKVKKSTNAPKQLLAIESVAGFTGAIALNSDMDGSCHQGIAIGSAAAYAAAYDNMLTVAAGAAATINDAATWTVPGGVVNNGELTVNGVLASAAENNGTLTIGDSGLVQGAVTNNGTLETGGTVLGDTVNNAAITANAKAKFGAELTNNGSIKVTGDKVNLGYLRDFGAVSLDDAAGTDTIAVTLTRIELSYGFAQAFDLADNILYIDFATAGGVSSPVANELTVATWEGAAQVDGDVCWDDFVFTNVWKESQGALTATNLYYNTGRNEDGHFILDTKEGDTKYTVSEVFDDATHYLKVGTSPYLADGFTADIASDFSIAFYATMPAVTNGLVVSIGTVAGGYMALVRGDTANEVRLVWGKGGSQEELGVFNVVAATKRQHLFMLVKTENDVYVYLDDQAQEAAHATWSTAYTLANQLQIAGIYGGDSGGQTGLALAGANREQYMAKSALMAMLRTYDFALNNKMRIQLAAEFPAEAVSDYSLLRLDGDTGTNTWYSAAGKWDINIETLDPDDITPAAALDGKLPMDNAHAILRNDSGSAQWLDVVLNDTTNDDDARINNLAVCGNAPVVIHKSIGGHAIVLAGAISNEVDLTIYYGAIKMDLTPLQLAEGAKLTFDLSDYLNALDTTGKKYLTGICAEFEEGRIACTNYDGNAVYALDGGLKYDSEAKRYYITVKARREEGKDVYLRVSPGASLTMAAETGVYYVDGGSTNYTRIIALDNLNFTGAGTVNVTNDLSVKKYIIPAGVTLEVSGYNFHGTIEGGGTLRCIGKPPLKDPSFLDEDNWTGTVEMVGVNFGNTQLDNFVNANSKLRLIGCSVFPSSDHYENIAIEIEDGETEGYGLAIKGVSNIAGGYVRYRKLYGEGTLVCTNTTAATTNYVQIADTSTFAGGINHAFGANGGVRLLIGAGAVRDDASLFEITTNTVYCLAGDIAIATNLVDGATNLVVRGTLKVAGDRSPLVDSPLIDFDGGTITICKAGAYPRLLGEISGQIAVDLSEEAGGNGIVAFEHLGVAGDDPPLAVTAKGNAAAYRVHHEDIKNDGGITRRYKLIRNFFYIRIR